MKHFLNLLLLLLSTGLIAQGPAGVNEEHLYQASAGINVPAMNVADESFLVQRISLSTGVVLEYVEKGDSAGLPVILLHGLCDSWKSFEPVLDKLPESIHAFSVTQRGHGESGKPAEGYTPADFAADVAAFIAEKRLGPVILVGHSMGGITALQFAVTYPSLLKALVVIDAEASFTDSPGAQEFYNEVMKLEGVIPREFMEGFQQSTLANPIDPHFYNTMVDEGIKTPVRVFQAALGAMLKVNLVSQLKEINCPALLIWGDKDAVCLQPGQELMAKEMKQAKLVVYEGIGHSPHWEKPDRVARHLRLFVKTLQFNPAKTQSGKISTIQDETK